MKNQAYRIEETQLEQTLMFKVDLTKIQGNGDFQCPKCGIKISPDDETDAVYCIMKETVIENKLKEIIIQCQKCRSHIRLIGFSKYNL